MCGTHKVISCFIKVLPFSSVSMTTDNHTPFKYGFHSLFFAILKYCSPPPPSPCRCVPTMHLWVRTSPGECGRHLLVRCLLCPGWFSSVDVKHLWHVEDALTGPLVPESLFLTDPQNSYFFKSPLRRQRMNNRVAQSGSSFSCCRRRKCRHW